MNISHFFAAGPPPLMSLLFIAIKSDPKLDSPLVSSRGYTPLLSLVVNGCQRATLLLAVSVGCVPRGHTLRVPVIILLHSFRADKLLSHATVLQTWFKI